MARLDVELVLTEEYPATSDIKFAGELPKKHEVAKRGPVTYCKRSVHLEVHPEREITFAKCRNDIENNLIQKFLRKIR